MIIVSIFRGLVNRIAGIISLFGLFFRRNRGDLRGEVFVLFDACARGDEFADDDVFLQPDQRIDLVFDRGFGENARGLLEGRRGQEGFRRERGLRDAEQGALSGRGALARFQRLEVFVLKAEDIQLFARKNIRVARVFHLNLLQHLADDDLDVFVVDIDALRTVDGLNFL